MCRAEPRQRGLSYRCSHSLRFLECLANVVEGVLGSLPGHVHKTLPMHLKTEIITARTAWRDPVSKQPEKFLRESRRVQDEVSVRARRRWKLVHPERGLGRFVIIPGHSRRIEKIEIPGRGLQSKRLREQVADLTLGVPDMDHREALEGCGFGASPREAIVSHHREPDSKALQIVSLELLDQFADNTLSVDAHRSRG